MPSGKLILAYRIWAALCLLLMMVMIACSPRQLKYDERYHVGLASMIHEHGWLNGLTSPQNQSAAGPLFPAIHNGLYFATSLEAPSIRWVNFVILIGILVVIYKTMSATRPFAEQITLSLLGIPFIWPSTVMALTELPALLAFSLSYYCLNLHLSGTKSTNELFLMPVIAGLFFGISILGRQTFLILIPVFGLVGICYRERMIDLFVFLFITLTTCVWVFVIWRGLVPESQAHTGNGINLKHGLMGLSYVGVASFIINPHAFFCLSKKVLFASFLVSLPCALIIASPDSIPFGTLSTGLASSTNRQVMSVAFWSVIFLFGIAWIMLLMKSFLRERRNLCKTLNTLIVLALAVAPFKVTHGFSSRYVVGTVGAEAVRSESFSPSYLQLAILLVCSAAGAWSAFSYLYR